MGAVGAKAPMVYESVVASTHGFWQLLSQFHQFTQNHYRKHYKYSNFLGKSGVKHPWFKIPNEAPVMPIK